MKQESLGKVLLIGGNPSNNVKDPYSKDVVVWDMTRPDNECATTFQDFPQGIVQGVAAMVYQVQCQ